MSLLEVKDLTINFGKQLIVSKVNFSIDKGSILALLGESGSGKTLTALSIMRLLPHVATPATQSEILFHQTDLLALPVVTFQKIRGCKIGMVFQEPMTALNPVLTIGDQIGEPLRRHLLLNRKSIFERTLELLHDVGFSDPKRLYSLYPHQISGGMRQRVVIAIAIAAQPELLIADEPTSALDVTTQAQILTLLQHLQAKLNLTILLITHDVKVAKKIADHVTVLHFGKVVEQAKVADFFVHPQHVYSQQLIAASTFPKRQLTNNEHRQQKIILKVQDLNVYFPIRKGFFKRNIGWVKAVDRVNLQIYQGQTLALAGESGCGKTTLARGLLRLIEPTSGEIFFEGNDIMKSSPQRLRFLRKDMQIIFQDPFASLNPRMLVGDIIAEGLEALKLVKSHTEQEERVDELLQQVDLPLESKHRYPHEFSGGQRQRIVIARALAVRPKLIICDEPTTALDVTTQTQIIDLLLELQQRYKLSYLFITHNIPLAASFADELAIMHEGRIVESGSADQILHHPQHHYTKELLSAVLE